MAAKHAKQPTDRVTVRLPVSLIHQMQALVEAGIGRNTTDIVYNAVKAYVVAQGTAAQPMIAAEKGLLAIQEELAKIQVAKKKLGLT